MLHALPFLLADISDKDQPLLLWYIVAGVVALSLFINAVLGAAVSWTQLRQSGRGDECASKADLREVHSRVDGITLGISSQVGLMRGELVSMLREEKESAHKHRDTVTHQLSGIERSVGRLEGMEKTLGEHDERLREVERRH